MIEVKVLGTGCAKCGKLYAEAEKAVSGSGVAARLEKVEKLEEIMAFNVMMTPALVVDGEVKSSGKIPKLEQIVGWLTTAAMKKED